MIGAGQTQGTVLYTLTEEQLHELALQAARQAVAMMPRQTDTGTESVHTMKEVADMFRVTTRTVHNWISRGLVTPTRIGGIERIDHTELQRLRERFIHRLAH